MASSERIFAMLALAGPTPGRPFQELLRYRMTCQARRRRRLANWRRLQSKKKVALILALTAALSVSFGPRTQTILMHPRSTHWWDYVVQRTFTHNDWIENFRVSKETFIFLCEKLKPVIKRMDTRLHNALCVQHHVAITLWFLATCGEYRTIGHLFGVARSTVCVIVHDTCGAIVNVFKSQYIQFPTGANLQQVINSFESKCQMIQCAGAIDGCHIPVKPPAQNHTDFYNRKGWYSIVLQGVVDHNYLFADVMVGWPGSVHDARVLANSHLYSKAINKEILNSNSIKISGKDIFPFLLGDSAYPLSTWLMKPFPHNSFSWIAKRLLIINFHGHE